MTDVSATLKVIIEPEGGVVPEEDEVEEPPEGEATPAEDEVEESSEGEAASAEDTSAESEVTVEEDS
jgi:hypothetical protein